MTAPIDPLVEEIVNDVSRGLYGPGDADAPAVARLSSVLAAARAVVAAIDDRHSMGIDLVDPADRLRDALAAADGSHAPPIAAPDLALWRAGCQAGFDIAAAAAGRDLTESTFWQSQVLGSLKAALDEGPTADGAT